MLKPLLLITLFLSIPISSLADVQVSEKIRPQVKSLVNLDIDRLAIPSTPHNMSLPEFGQDVIGRGTGAQDAETRLKHVSKADVEKMKRVSLTVEIAKTWQNFYKNETQRNAGNPTAPLRAQLMKKIIDLW